MEEWERQRDRFKEAFPDAECHLVAHVIQRRYRVFARGRYWGHSQKHEERAWLSAVWEWSN